MYALASILRMSLRTYVFDNTVYGIKLTSFLHSLPSRASRRGQWEEIARDRERFRKRIINAQMALGGIFSNFHRGVMFQSIHASGTCPCHPDDGDSEPRDYEDCSDGETV